MLYEYKLEHIGKIYSTPTKKDWFVRVGFSSYLGEKRTTTSYEYNDVQWIHKATNDFKYSEEYHNRKIKLQELKRITICNSMFPEKRQTYLYCLIMNPYIPTQKGTTGWVVPQWIMPLSTKEDHNQLIKGLLEEMKS